MFLRAGKDKAVIPPGVPLAECRPAEPLASLASKDLLPDQPVRHPKEPSNTQLPKVQKAWIPVETNPMAMRVSWDSFLFAALGISYGSVFRTQSSLAADDQMHASCESKVVFAGNTPVNLLKPLLQAPRCNLVINTGMEHARGRASADPEAFSAVEAVEISVPGGTLPGGYDESPRDTAAPMPIGDFVPPVGEAWMPHGDIEAAIDQRFAGVDFGGVAVRVADVITDFGGPDPGADVSAMAVHFEFHDPGDPDRVTGTAVNYYYRDGDGVLWADHADQCELAGESVDAFNRQLEAWYRQSAPVRVTVDAERAGRTELALAGYGWALAEQDSSHAVEVFTSLRAQHNFLSLDAASLQSHVNQNFETGVWFILGQYQATDPAALLEVMRNEAAAAEVILRRAREYEFGTAGYPSPLDVIGIGTIGREALNRPGLVRLSKELGADSGGSVSRDKDQRPAERRIPEQRHGAVATPEQAAIPE